MREIKFRAWDKVNKCWFKQENNQGDPLINHYISLDGWLWDKKHINSDNPDENDSLSKGEFELQQFTGLLDKNGKEIYEGDILQFSDKTEWYRNELFLKSKEKQYEILNDDIKYPKETRVASLDFETNYYEWLYPCSDLKCYWEVIGNIFENPDLLTSHKA